MLINLGKVYIKSNVNILNYIEWMWFLKDFFGCIEFM